MSDEKWSPEVNGQFLEPPRSTSYDDEMLCIDPKELSFHLEADENSPPFHQHADNEMNTGDRVYRFWEFNLIDWDGLKITELKQWMQFFGMKTSGGRKYMVRQLKDIFDYLADKGDQPKLASRIDSVPSAPNKELIYSKITQAIKSEKLLYEKILMFESLEVPEIQATLLRSHPDMASVLSLKNLKEYVQLMGVQVSNTSENNATNLRRARKKHRRQSVYDDDLVPSKPGKRQLRKSLTCP